jgi:hypothetical protein
MLKGGAEFQRQKVLNRAAGNWNKEFFRTTDKGVARIRQVACIGVKCEFMDNERWGWECMLQLQETENRKTPAATTWVPAATTWVAEFSLSVGESREFLRLWINSGAIHEANRRRATQVITCSFPCGKWQHMIGARESPRCELCRREGRHGQEAIEHLPEETIHTFKVQDEKRKRRASLGLTTGVGSISYVPSPSMGRRNVNSNLLGKTKTGSWSHCGEKRTSEGSYHGRILRMKRQGY